MLRDISQDPTTARTLQGAGHVEIQNISRRGFLGVSGTAFALALFPAPVQAFTRFKVGGSSMPQGLREDPLLFVSLTADGLVTVIVHRSEMGQGIRTSFAMVIADELGADWAQMRVRQAPGDEPKYGNQDTEGSRSMRHHIQALRYMGAAMRQMLINAAAAEWGVDASQVSAGVNEIKSASRSATFGELAAGAMQQPVPRFEDLTFKTEEQFRYIGKGSILAIDLDDIVTGKAVYGADVALAGVKYAVIARPPVIGAKVLSYDSEAALGVPGVERILMIPVNDLPIGFAPLGGIAVIAAHTDVAIKGRDALVINWGDSRHDGYDSEAFTAEMRATAKKPGKVIRAEGQPKVAFEKAARVFGREYGQAHMAHAPMEPPVAVADVLNGKAEIWGPLQSPYRARQEIAKIIGLDVENVTVNVTLLGGGFGRKSVPDFAAEAAILSQKVGAPIKVQWTREDDIQHSMYHTTAVERLEVALDADNQVTGWRHNSVHRHCCRPLHLIAAISFLSSTFKDMWICRSIFHMSASKMARLWRTPALVGSDRSQMCTVLGRFKRLFPNLPPSLAKTSLTCNCVCLVPTGICNQANKASQRIFGTTEKTVKPTQLTPSGSKMFSDGLPKRPAGGGQCQPVKAWDLPFTDRSFPMWPAVYMSKSLMGRSRYLLCIRQLTAGSLPIRSVFAARWKVPQ